MATTDLTFAVTQEITLQAPVQNNGTVSFPYPRGETATSRAWVGSGCVLADGAGNIYTSGFSVAFGSSSITVTNTSGTTLAAGRRFRLQVNIAGTGQVVRDPAGQTVSSITATSGGSQTTAAELQWGFNTVTGNIADTVRLPNATGSGRRLQVYTATTYFIIIYPAVGEQMSTFGANAAYGLFGHQMITFVDVSSGQWQIETNFPILYPVNFVTAFAGGGQGSATQLTYGTVGISTCASDGDSVKLPAPIGGLSPQVVTNYGAKTARLYPGSGQYLNSVSTANLYIDIPPGRTAMLWDIGPWSGTTQAWCGGLLPVQDAAPATQTGTTYTVGANDKFLTFNAAGTVTLTLPSAASNVGREITVKTIAAQAVNSASSNVAPLTSGTAGTAILAATAGKWARLVSDGTNWVTMAAA